MSGYSTLKSDLMNIFVDNDGSGTPSSDFLSILPTAILYGETRINKKLDFLNQNQTDTSVTCTPSTRSITLPTTLKIIDSLAVITPAATNPDAGTRNTLERVSLDWLDMVYPVAATAGVPLYYALKDDTVAILAPTPAAAYKVEAIGIVNPTTLSEANPDTYLTTNYYTLLLTACCVFMAGWQKDYGAQTDDPQIASSWETQYTKLEALGLQDSWRQKAEMPGGNSYTQTPSSTKSA